MNWHLVETGSNRGKFNMDFDLELASEYSGDDAYFRLYRWAPYCISLGANQNFSDINIIKAETDGIDVVKRPTGGRAILHAEELTYSVIMPLNKCFSPKEIYSEVSKSLIKGFAIYNPLLSHAELETSQPNFPSLLNQPAGTLCFASTAKSEVKYNGKKLIGSAQRKYEKAVLQHGSILCGKFHRNLPEFLNYDKEKIDLLKGNLDQKTIELSSILNREIDPFILEDHLIKGFEETWNTGFEILHKEDIKI